MQSTVPPSLDWVASRGISGFRRFRGNCAGKQNASAVRLAPLFDAVDRIDGGGERRDGSRWGEGLYCARSRGCSRGGTATITITAFERSPDGGKGLARDTRVRWARSRGSASATKFALSRSER